MSPLIFIAVLFATLVTDALWALYLIKVTERAPFLAASYGSLIHILTAFTVISYTKNYFYETVFCVFCIRSLYSNMCNRHTNLHVCMK